MCSYLGLFTQRGVSIAVFVRLQLPKVGEAEDTYCGKMDLKSVLSITDQTISFTHLIDQGFGRYLEMKRYQ